MIFRIIFGAGSSLIYQEEKGDRVVWLKITDNVLTLCFGSCGWGAPYHLNQTSAERAAAQMEGMHWLVFVDPENPQISALENPFPFREVLYGVCLVGIFFYLVYLRFQFELLSKNL